MSLYIFICSKNSVFVDYDNLPSNFNKKYIGEIDTFDAEFSINIQNKNIYLIKFINHDNDIVFNKKQMIILKGEINILKNTSSIKKSILTLLETAITYGLQENDVYLKSEID